MIIYVYYVLYNNIYLYYVQYADQSLMKSAIKTSEESWIEQQMLEDKKRATDWEATNEAIEEQVARESYLQWLQDQEKQARQVSFTSQWSLSRANRWSLSLANHWSLSLANHWSLLGMQEIPKAQIKYMVQISEYVL